MTQFRQDEANLKQNYIDLSESTGESFDSIARRIEDNAGDAVTAAKVRALGGDRDAAPKQRHAPAAKKSTAAEKAKPEKAADGAPVSDAGAGE